MFPTNATLGATLPAGAALQSFVLEAILTFLLMFVILSVSSGSKEKQIADPRDMTPDQFRDVRNLIGRKVKELIATL